MPREIISTSEAPQSPMYSQAVKAGHTIYVAGTPGIDVATGEFAGATVKEQARQSLLNCHGRRHGLSCNNNLISHANRLPEVGHASTHHASPGWLLHDVAARRGAGRYRCDRLHDLLQEQRPFGLVTAGPQHGAAIAGSLARERLSQRRLPIPASPVIGTSPGWPPAELAAEPHYPA